MRQFHTVVLERMEWLSGAFSTEPYETAWASEATFFIRILESEVKDWKLEAKVQTSVDGVDWVDEGTIFPTINKLETSFVKVNHFGGYLRLNCNLKPNEARIRTTIHLVLKE